MLNPKQIKILDTNSNVKILRGPYGSGKTVLARLLLRQFYEKALKLTKTVIYYVNYDPWSILDIQIKDVEKKFIDKNSEHSNIKIKVVDRAQLYNILGIKQAVLLSELFKKLCDFHRDTKIFIIVDEFKKETLTEFEFLKSMQYDITATIIVQPLEYATDSREKDSQSKKYHFLL